MARKKSKVISSSSDDNSSRSQVESQSSGERIGKKTTVQNVGQPPAQSRTSIDSSSDLSSDLKGYHHVRKTKTHPARGGAIRSSRRTKSLTSSSSEDSSSEEDASITFEVATKPVYDDAPFDTRENNVPFNRYSSSDDDHRDDSGEEERAEESMGRSDDDDHRDESEEEERIEESTGRKRKQSALRRSVKKSSPDKGSKRARAKNAERAADGHTGDEDQEAPVGAYEAAIAKRASGAASAVNKVNLGNKTSIYRGVGWVKQSQKWEVKLKVFGRVLHCGLFDDEVEAAKVYDEAAFINHGPHFPRNFEFKGVPPPQQSGLVSKYRGVSRDKRSNKWRSTLRIGKKQYYLGRFEDEELAAKAYDAKARELFGANAFLNFPDKGAA